MNRLNGLKKYYHQYERNKHIEKLLNMTKDTNFTISTSISAKLESNNATDPSYSILVGDLIKNFLKNWLDYIIESWHIEVCFLENT